MGVRMSAEDNKAVVRRFIAAAWNRGNLEVINEVVAEDHIDHDPADVGSAGGRMLRSPAPCSASTWIWTERCSDPGRRCCAEPTADSRGWAFAPWKRAGGLT